MNSRQAASWSVDTVPNVRKSWIYRLQPTILFGTMMHPDRPQSYTLSTLLSKKYYLELLDKYAGLKSFFLKGLESAGLEYTDPQGAYYVMVDISGFNAADDVEFCEWMIREVGVAGVPGSSFFRNATNNFVRFHFAKKKETLETALQRLGRLKEKVGSLRK